METNSVQMREIRKLWMKPCFDSLSAGSKLLVWLLNCSVVIELLYGYWTNQEKKLTKRWWWCHWTMSGEEIRTYLWYSLGHCWWKHTTVAVQMTLTPTATHSNALLTISLLTSCYILTVHLYTVHIKNYVAFVKKEDLLFLLLFKTD